MVAASSAFFSSTDVTSGATTIGEEPSKGSEYDGFGEAATCVIFPDDFFEASGVVFVIGVVIFGLGTAFCVNFGAVFDFAEDVFLFELTGINSVSSMFDTIDGGAGTSSFPFRSRCVPANDFLGFGVGFTLDSTGTTLVSERVASDMEE